MRIAMWSGPRNISTAMMRSFENRPDCAVVDEPFYAAYLAQTGLVHPMRDEVLASQSTEWRVVADSLTGEAPRGAAVFYQKHMTHHMLPAFGLDWTAACVNAFLIRDPAEVLASYVQKRAEVTLDDIGVVRQRALFEREADRLGRAPVVVEGADVLADPSGTLGALCASRSDRKCWPGPPAGGTATASGPRPGMPRSRPPPVSPRRSGARHSCSTITSAGSLTRPVRTTKPWRAGRSGPHMNTSPGGTGRGPRRQAWEGEDLGTAKHEAQTPSPSPDAS